GQESQNGIDRLRAPIQIKILHGVLVAVEKREFANFCNYCKDSVRNKKGKGTVHAAADQQENQAGLEDRRDQPEHSIETLHLCASLPQQLTLYKPLHIYPDSLIVAYRPAGHVLGVHFGGGLLPSAMSGVEQLAASNRSAKMTRTRWFIAAFPTTREVSMRRTLGCSGLVEFPGGHLIYGVADFLF
ncbi:MAG TPA: hypothetical protein VGP65_14980, partial [Candidatus Angelobacter sp.]|nr:hypothetical protein [Candidatus Angelobacter sp.]